MTNFDPFFDVFHFIILGYFLQQGYRVKMLTIILFWIYSQIEAIDIIIYKIVILLQFLHFFTYLGLSIFYITLIKNHMDQILINGINNCNPAIKIMKNSMLLIRPRQT